MAQHFEAKGAAEVVTRRFAVPVAKGDAVSGLSHTASGVTVDSAENEADELVFVLSGGTAGATGAITATVTTDQGETLVFQFYIPVVAPDATGMTVRDVCEFALRKVWGKDESPDGTSISDAVERLSDMLLAWRASGADVGATYPLTDATVINCKPEFQAAIKNNLILQIADLYDVQIGALVVENARRGLQLIKNANLPADRAGPEYY